MRTSSYSSIIGMISSFGIAGLGIAGLAGGCGNTSLPPMECSDTMPCPSGQTCNSEGKCEAVTVIDMTMVTEDCSPACSGTTPHCDKSTKTCVGCLVDAHCAAGTLCKAGSCKAGCSSMQPSCAPDAGTCDVDLGVCRRGCAKDSECQQGTPRCDVANEKCVVCLPQNDNCPQGMRCSLVGGQYNCVAGCKAKTDCGGGQDCCGNMCISVDTNMNCGGCGVACGVGTNCCGGKCVNVTSDPANCGACGFACTAANATTACTNGMCNIASCKTGYADCNNNFADGCETETANNLNHCGACNKACPFLPNATPVCMSGTCSLGTCDGNWGNCDNDASNGCETNVLGNNSHCGACNKACGSGTTCTGGKCTLVCQGDLRDCDGDSTNGCETNIKTNPQHCAACGNVCNIIINGTPSCTNGLCGLGSCNTGYADCDKDPITGCEAKLDSDAKNCGVCGKACAGQNGTGVCQGGTCSMIQCNTNFGNCDGDVSNGCEADLMKDLNNCGMCGTKCQMTFTCQSGTCQPPGVTYTHAFPQGNVNQTDAQCVDWKTFQSKLTGTYNTIIMKGSNNPTGVTCTGGGANQLCQALRNNMAISIQCDGRTWATGMCGNGMELSAQSGICSCLTPAYTVRPCINNNNWGGINTTTCGGPMQTMTVICQ